MRDFAMPVGFLSIQAQDFIEDCQSSYRSSKVL